MSKPNRDIQLMKVKRSRSARGSIAEGVVATWLIVSVSIAALFLLINVGLVLLAQQKASSVAAQAAKHLANGRYWMGMERNDFNAKRTDLEDEAFDLAVGMLAKLKLGSLKRSNFKPSYEKVNIGQNGQGWITSLTITVDSVKLLDSDYLPIPATGISVKATGVAEESATVPYCVGILGFNSTNPPVGAPIQTVVFPAYYPLSGTGQGGWRQYAFAKPGYPMGNHNYPRVYVGTTNVNPIYPANPQGSQVQDKSGNPVGF